MRPAEEARMMAAIDNAIAQLEMLRPLAMLAIALDDQPAELRDRKNDIVGKRVGYLNRQILDVESKARSAVKYAKNIGQNVEKQQERVSNIPKCPVDPPHPALPSPSLGMCKPHYDRFIRWSAKQKTINGPSDIAKWVNLMNDELDELTSEGEIAS